MPIHYYKKSSSNREIVSSKTPPENTTKIWLDTTNMVPVMKDWDERAQDWIVISGSSKSEYLSVNTLVERDSIPIEKRLEGMLCYVISEDSIFQLKGGITNISWAILSLGSASINDNAIEHTTTWSSAKILEKLTEKINGASEKDIVYQYYVNGDIKEELIYDISVTPNVLLQKKTYVYSANGDIITETIKLYNREFVNTFIYNANGDIFKVEVREVM